MQIIKTQTDKLVVGSNDVSYTAPDTSPTGTAVLNGPVYVGKPSAAPGYDAVFNVGTQPADQLPGNQQPPMSTPLGIKLDGSMEIVGDGRVPNALKISGGQLNKLYVDGDAVFTGQVDCGNKGALAARFAVADSKPKPFDIEHPTKGEGHRLRYACIEGPEVGVYHRGRLRGENVIKLPYYWKDLVHADSITVQLQPIGQTQNLVIQEFDNEQIVIVEEGNIDFFTDESIIDCFYHVYGERKDINPLIVEYEGNSWEDYPDPNFNPNKVSDDKRTYNDPRFDGPPNTMTT